MTLEVRDFFIYLFLILSPSLNLHKQLNRSFRSYRVALRSITKLDNFDEKKFKLIDKVCQMIYNNHKENL